VCEQWRPGRHRRLRKRPRCERTRVRACAQCDGWDACSRSWKVEPEGGGRLFVETWSFRIIFVSFLREIMFPHVQPIRCDQKTHRSVYFTAGQEKNIFLPQGVSDFWWSREYSQSYLKRMSQNIWEMVRFGWVLKWKWCVSGGKKDLGNFHIVQPIRCDPANASFRVLYCGSGKKFRSTTWGVRLWWSREYPRYI